MQIDGEIWLGTTTGKIWRLSKGEQVEFNIRGLSSDFNSTITLYTKENFANIYVLEPTQKRIVILSKDGNFVKEFQSEMLSTATGLIADETNHHLYAVSGSLLYLLDF